jgi:hypothetical protein
MDIKGIRFVTDAFLLSRVSAVVFWFVDEMFYDYPD